MKPLRKDDNNKMCMLEKIVDKELIGILLIGILYCIESLQIGAH